VDRVQAVAAAGGRIAFATASPASLVTVHLALANLAGTHGAEVVELADAGPVRADGRSPRWLRWVGGVAAVTDGLALLATTDGEAAREFMFVMPRPALVVGDGPFAEVAWEAGVEVVAIAGLDRPALAIAAARGQRCTVVPVRTDRAPPNYRVLEELLRPAEIAQAGPEM
jgi:hypothetical protein